VTIMLLAFLSFVHITLVQFNRSHKYMTACFHSSFRVDTCYKFSLLFHPSLFPLYHFSFQHSKFQPYSSLNEKNIYQKLSCLGIICDQSSNSINKMKLLHMLEVVVKIFWCNSVNWSCLDPYL